MAFTDPRVTLKTMVDAWMALNTPVIDDNVTPATFISLWESGPERMKYLFFDAGTDYDFIMTFGNPETRSTRPIQDIPVHYQMVYPITVTTTDKYTAGVLVSTGVYLQYKVTWEIRDAIEFQAQSVPAAVPAYTARVTTERTIHKRVGGIDIWETTHRVEYELGE